MAKIKKPLESVLSYDEDIFWEGKPEKIPYILNAISGQFLNFIFIVLSLIILPVLYFNLDIKLNLITNIFILVTWCLDLYSLYKLIKLPFIKILEWSKTYYMITNKRIYIQFGIDKIYYRAYSLNRIGTKAFYRRNKIDTSFFTGTIGFSVDDYYEERICSIKDYENVFKIFKTLTDQKAILVKNEKNKEEENRRIFLEQERKIEAQAREKYEKKYREEYEKAMSNLNNQIANERTDINDDLDDEEIERKMMYDKYSEYRENLQKKKEKELASKNDKHEENMDDDIEVEYPVSDDYNIVSVQPKQNKTQPPRRAKKKKKNYNNNNGDANNNGNNNRNNNNNNNNNKNVNNNNKQKSDDDLLTEKPKVEYGTVNGDKPNPPKVDFKKLWENEDV